MLKRAKSQDNELLLDGLRPPNNPKWFPGSHNTSLEKSSRRTKYLSGWRLSVVGCAVLGLTIFSLNLGVTIWVVNSFTTIKGVATVYEGSCANSKSYTTWIHLGINILGTLLLGASNYCMQVLCSPTREEIDAAHARHRWLSVGVPSFKNLFYIERKKCLLWLVLGLSSVPLHLLWNSAIVDTLSSNDYMENEVTENFLDGASLNPNISTNLLQDPDLARAMVDKYNLDQLVFLSVEECIKAYTPTLVSEYGNVLIVYGNTGNTSLLSQDTHKGNNPGSTNVWLCGYHKTCDPNILSRENATHWDPTSRLDIHYASRSTSQQDEVNSLYFEGYVKYCLAEKVDHPCRLGMSPPILITVLICNAIKTLCFMLTLCFVGAGFPLVTNGDVVESFLLRPDASLQGRCLASKLDVETKSFWSTPSLPLEWRSKRRRWAAGASKGFWLSTFIPGSLLIIVIFAVCLANGLWGGGIGAVVNQGFGKPSTSNLVGEGIYGVQRSAASASLVANIPQLLVSYIYLAYNGLFTSMLATAEWVGYSIRPRGLRVTWPKGHQRSRAFLQLPYTYAIPIMTASTILHWLISQSLFLVRITIYTSDGKEAPGAAISSVGFSPYAIIFAVCMGGAMLIAVLLVGTLRRYPATMPLAACCSASIAAACEPQERGAGTDRLAYGRVQWGVVDQGMMMADGGQEIQYEHACFSAKEVTPLVAGRTYA